MPIDPTSDFYEDDEPIEDIRAAWAAGEHGTTRPPAGIVVGTVTGNVIEDCVFVEPARRWWNRWLVRFGLVHPGLRITAGHADITIIGCEFRPS